MANIKQTSLADLYFIEDENVQTFRQDIIFADVDVSTFSVNNIFPVRASTFSLFIIERGHIEIELDYKRHFVRQCCFLIILPEHLIQSMKLSNDFRGRLMIINQSYYSSVEKDNLRLHHPLFLNVKKLPILQLNEYENCIINFCWDRIKQVITYQNHHFKEDLIKTILIEFMLEMDNILIDRKYGVNHQKLPRQEELVQKFFHLLKDYGKIEHKVSFYADRLHITPQYLAIILKQQTGKTTHKWIAEALIIEAKILLKHTQLSVAQISDTLNFCDPSAFGKFFKTYTKITPFQFRKNRN